MPNEIKAKFAAPAALTITLAALASSTAGVGRQSTLVDNSTARYQRVIVFVKVRLGTSPTNARAIYVYGIRSDGTLRTGGAGASDAAITMHSQAALIGIIPNKTTGSATGDDIIGEVVFENPGPEWGVAIVHDTGVNLDADSGNHSVSYVGVNTEVQ